MSGLKLLLLMTTAMTFAGLPAWATDAVVPGDGFAASRYETLWTKSPFAVATAEAAPDSPDYSLVGIAQFDGVSYASLINKQNQEHFLVATDKPAQGLTLISVTRGHDASDTSAVLQKDGQSLTLKLEQPVSTPQVAANSATGSPVMNGAQMSGMGMGANYSQFPGQQGALPMNSGPISGVVPQQIPMPGAGTTGNFIPGQGQQVPPLARIHPRVIRVPPNPQQMEQVQPQPAQ